MGTEFLLSMVEAHNVGGNGNLNTMDSGFKAQQELEKIEQQIERLQALEGQNEESRRQVQQLHDRVNDLRREVSSHLNPWERTEMARHPQRPYTLDYVERIFTDWSEIHGDRGFADDPAIVCGMARFHGEEVLIVGHQKARDTKQKVYRNFGMPNPEGYRKRCGRCRSRQVSTADFHLYRYPGAHPDSGAEGARTGRSHRATTCARWSGSKFHRRDNHSAGGSGEFRALIAVGDRVLMMENSIYSAISPEVALSCGAIRPNANITAVGKITPRISASSASSTWIVTSLRRALTPITPRLPSSGRRVAAAVSRASATASKRPAQCRYAKFPQHGAVFPGGSVRNIDSYKLVFNTDIHDHMI
jgi:acetyl-CoA carboxylase carboxyl transferase subunit alpha